MSDRRPNSEQCDTSEMCMAPLDIFTPFLVPESVRPSILRPITLLRRFTNFFYWTSIIIVFAIGIILGTVPHIPETKLPLLIQGLLSIVFLTIFISIVFSLNVRRINSCHQLNKLRDYCNGDITAAPTLALDVASDSDTLTLATALALMDTTEINSTSVRTALAPGAEDAGENLQSNDSVDIRIVAEGFIDIDESVAKVSEPQSADSGYIDDEGGRYSAQYQKPPPHREIEDDGNDSRFAKNGGETIIEVIGENSTLLPRTDSNSEQPHPYEYKAAAAEGTMRWIENSMEKDPMFIFHRIINSILDSERMVVIFLPLSSFFAGYILCKLGVKINGVELIFGGFLMVLIAPLLWHGIKKTVVTQLNEAEEEVYRWQRKAYEEQKARELEELQKRIKEAEAQREREIALAKQKEKELADLKAASSEGEAKKVQEEEQQQTVFGLSLPKIDFNPFTRKEDQQDV